MTATAAAVLGAALAAGEGASPELLCHPPTADAGGPYRVECSGSPASVALDGAFSFGCDPSRPLAFAWSSDCPGASLDDPTAVRPTLTVASPPPCPLACSVELRVTDPQGGSAVDRTTLTVEDTLPPALDAETGDVLCLWPPDGRELCLAAESLPVSARDACGLATLRLVSCTPDEGGAEACRVSPAGDEVCVRAKRLGTGAGRRYRLTAVAADGCGNESPETAVGALLVPHDQRAGCR